MSIHRKLPSRESVFVASLLHHGFRITYKRKSLKLRRGYIIPATKREDSSGIDFWVKMPNDYRYFPIQITQRGVRFFRIFHNPTPEQLQDFVKKSTQRIAKKQRLCREHGVAFVLVRDHVGNITNRSLAWGDLKALKYAIAHLRRWL